MRLIYDPESDAAFIYFTDGIGKPEIARTDLCDIALDQGAVIAMFDSEDRLAGLEILGAANLLGEDVLRSPGTSET